MWELLSLRGLGCFAKDEGNRGEVGPRKMLDYQVDQRKDILVKDAV